MLTTGQSSKWCARCMLTVPPHRTHRCTRVFPSASAGYGPGRFVARYYDEVIDAWFDIGEPHDSEGAAKQAAAEYERTGTVA